MDPKHVESLITTRTRAILGVHLWGRPCDTARLEALGRRHDIPVFYDAAHAFGVSQGGRRVGNFGCCEVFSFHATKFVHTFEGGAITTNDDALAERLRLLRNFGLAGADRVTCLGINAKMPEVCAAMGLASLSRLDAVVEANRKAYQLYRRALEDIAGIRLMPFDDVEQANWQYLVLEVDSEVAGVTRDELVDALHVENVLAKRYFYPGCHRAQPYVELYPQQCEALPLTDGLCQRVMVLPTGPSVAPEHIEFIGELIRLKVGA